MEEIKKIVYEKALSKLIDSYESVELKTIELQISYESTFVELESNR